MHRDLIFLFCSRTVRLFAFGLTSVTLAIYLTQRGLSSSEVGVLFTLALLGDAIISLILATRADRWGRRRVLMVSGALVVLGGWLMASGGAFWVLVLGATIGVISPSGGEAGPFLAVEQASLAQLVPDERRTAYIAWYNVAGFSATALGAYAGGWLASLWQSQGQSVMHSYEWLLWLYSGAGLVLTAFSLALTRRIEVPKAKAQPGVAGHWSGLTESKPIVMGLASLFMLDAFAGGFVVQSILAYWFALRFNLTAMELGQVFFATNLLSGVSALVAVPLSKRIGLINTMVFTHLPSNILLLLVPLMPSATLAVTFLLLRHFLSQMDVPTRQSYVMAVVPASERSAANGITATARSLGSALSPALAGHLLGHVALVSFPIYIAASLKIVYDLALYRQFQQVRPPEEKRQQA